MKISIKDRILGYAVLTLNECDKDYYIGKFIEYNVIFKTLDTSGGYIKLAVPLGELKYIKKLFYEKCPQAEIRGLPKYIIRYRHRPGLLVGALLSIVLCVYFSLIVWDIQISGNENISDGYIQNILKENGLELGVYRDSVDVDKIVSNILIKDGKFGWFSINFRGTTAFVEVMEFEKKNNDNTDTAPQNIVAARDGYILELAVDNGVAAIKRGESVKAGDLLISGIVDSNTHGYLLERAKGSVIAEVFDRYKIEVPYKREEKTYTGESKREKSVIFFSKGVKVCKKGGKVGEMCDIIEEVERIDLFDNVKLPIFVSDKLYNGYEIREYEMTPEAAASYAYAELENTLELITKEGEIISKSVNGYATDTAYVIELEVYRTAEISKPQKLSLAQNIS